MKLLYAGLLFSGLIFASTANATSSGTFGMKFGKSIKNNINESAEFKKDGVKITEAMGVGFYYSSNEDAGRGLGFEGELYKNQLADVKVGDIDVGDVSTYKVGFYANYLLPVTDAAYAKAKLGYERSVGDADFITGNTVELNESGLSFGVGLGMDLSDKFGLLAEYKYTDSAEKMNLISIGSYRKF